jgi:hypothetical protein
MALPILTKTDFIGKIRISLNNYSSFDDYITQIEPVILNEILGADATQEITDDVTLKAKYDDLLNGGYYTNTECDDETVYFRGLKDYMKYRVYAEFMRDNFASSISGLVKSLNENSVKLTGGELSQVVYNRYNEAITIYEDSIYPYLYFYREIKETCTSSVDNTGTYTINLASTTYLYDGDTVEIDGVEYVISNLVADTSFDITNATGGLDFSGAELVWKPYYDVEQKFFNKTWL